MKTKITFGFKSKTQMPLFMVIKEYYDDDGNIEFAKVLFRIKGKQTRELEKRIGAKTYKWQSMTMGNIVETFGDVLKQAWESLVKYHTLDIKWKYNKNGF
jgi:hypothetical protein